MAARRLKFKPKPSVANSARRARDKDDFPGLIQNEQSVIDKESTKAVSSEESIKSECKIENTNLSSETDNQSNKKLNLELNVNKVDLTCDVSESEPTGTPADESVVSEPCEEQGSKNILSSKLSLSNECNRVPLNGLSLGNSSSKKDLSSSQNSCTSSLSSITAPNREADGTINISTITDVNTRISENCIDLDVSCSSSVEIEKTNSSDAVTEHVSTNLHTKDSICDKSSTKPEPVKIPSRFGRSRCKPVLNNTSLRKKNETVESVKNASNFVNSRTDSVIKSVESELSKMNSVLKENEEHINSSDVDKQKQASKSDQLNVIPSQKCLANDDVQTKIVEENQSAITSTVNNFLNSSSKTEHSNEKNINEVPVKNPCDEEPNSTSKKIPKQNETHVEVSDSSSVKKTPNKVPLSPLRPTSKILVPKPSPRLTDSTSRRISFQGSDSEEESKKRTLTKEKIKVLKNDKEEKTLKNSKRKRSLGPTFSKLGQETMKELTKKLNGTLGNPDKNKLTMLDLIFYNPKNNPMSAIPNQTPAERKKEAKIEVSQVIEETLDEQSVDDVEATPSALPVPQLKVGPDGQVMLDPHSLVIETTGMNKSREELENSEVIQENGITRYNSYSKRRHKRSEWTPQETLQFYRVLSTIGSDFSLMAQLFPKRTRHDLKLKFKREERTNMHLVDKAMTMRSGFDFQTLECELKRENEEIERKKTEKEEAKEAARKLRAERKEEMSKNKKRSVDKGIRMRNCALKEFSKDELDLLYKPKRKMRCISKKRKSRKTITSDKDTDEELMIDSEFLEDDTLSLVSSITDITHNRHRSTKKLKEFEEINETLKKEMELESRKDKDIFGKKSDCDPESEEDVYTPNGPGAYMLFGSPQNGSEEVEEEPTHVDSDRPWNIEIQTLPNIEETVMVDNIEEVSELSELGSFGQNDIALDLSIPVRSTITSEMLKGTQVERSLLDRHLISESIQIIDQLTSTETSTSCTFTEVKEIDGDHSEDVLVKEELADSKFRLPSFESVSRSRPSIAYSLQVPSDSSNYVVQEVMAERPVQETGEGSSPPNVFVGNFYRETEECILGE